MFVVFRLRKKLKTGKLESAGFCSPKSATESAFIPWAMNTKGKKLFGIEFIVQAMTLMNAISISMSIGFSYDEYNGSFL